MNNLINQYNVKSTRTQFYSKSERFADYILTSKDVCISDFKVLPDEVSDHAPLFVEYDDRYKRTLSIDMLQSPIINYLT